MSSIFSARRVRRISRVSVIIRRQSEYDCRVETKIKPKHNVTLESRRRALVTGVEKVVDASPSVINTVTSEGALSVRGSGLKIVSFSEADGTLTFEGTVDRMEYAAAKKPLLRRLFG